MHHVYGSMCQLLLNKLHNGHLTALFLEVPHAEFLEKTIQLFFDFTVEKVCSLPLSTKWKCKCPVVVGYLPVQVLRKVILAIPTDKSSAS